MENEICSSNYAASKSFNSHPLFLIPADEIMVVQLSRFKVQFAARRAPFCETQPKAFGYEGAPVPVARPVSISRPGLEQLMNKQPAGRAPQEAVCLR
jgi:hypothetical protein